MTKRYRCTDHTNCGARVTLAKSIELYRKRPVCPGCKKDKLKCVTKYERARDKLRTCKCDGIIYPHSKGTEPWCEYAKVGPTEEDQKDRHGKY